MGTASKIFLLLFLTFPSMGYCATFAQLAIGGGYEATLLVSNKLSVEWFGRIYARQGMNQPWGARWWIGNAEMTGSDYLPFTLAANETKKFIIRGEETVETGYLHLAAERITQAETDVAVSYFYIYRDNGVLRTVTGSGESKFNDVFYFPAERNRARGVDTGIAMCPRTNDTFQVTMTAYNGAGAVVATRNWPFEGHKAEFISQTFPGLPIDFVGYIKVELSNSGMFLEVIRMDTVVQGDFTSFLLTSTPADDRVP
jgi:hypothetical protein